MQMGLEEYELSLKGILLICFQRLYSQYFAKLRTSDVKGAPKIEIQQSISFLNEHFAEDISIVEL